MRELNILIYGSGALGSIVGAYASEDYNVTLYGREPHINAITKSGLQVVGVNGQDNYHNLEAICHPNQLVGRFFDLVITSPPYMNGLDYVVNYKIEMGWLDFVKSQSDLKRVKDEMVVCDNVSKGLIKNFNPKYTNEWIENIKRNIQKNIVRRGKYRRQDMPFIVHKYFDDMYKVLKKVVNKIQKMIICQ